MISEKETTNKIERIAKEIFNSIDFVEILEAIACREGSFANWIPDLQMCVQARNGTKYRIIFEVKSTGQPRFARMAVNQLREFISNRENIYGVFASTFISEDSQKICKDNSIGFLDLAGNCFFNFDNIYISVEGRKNPYPTTRPLKTIFNSKSSRVLRVLLQNPGKLWFVKDLATEAKISIGQASLVKNRLLEYEYISPVKMGRKVKFKLVKWNKLLNEWANNYSYKKNNINSYYSIQDIDKIENNIAKYFDSRKNNYAFTLTSGGSLVAPFLRYNTVFLYLQGNSGKLAKDLDFKKVDSGPNVSILEPYDGGIFYGLQKIDGKVVVSDIQLYLDLINYKGRGEEAAEFLLEQRIREKW
ncbi:MAG: type IV toxin-antitoxin system AbiEi family antitoxin [Candidatus Humimicrobiaceae bacterium]